MNRPSVKPFSLSFRLPAAIILLYGAWFFANLWLAGVTPEANAGSRPEIAREPGWFGYLIASVFLAAGVAMAGYLLFFDRAQDKAEAGREDSIYGYLKTASFVMLLVLTALHVKVCAVERVEVSGSSMFPNLENGSVIWIEKLSSGIQMPELEFPFGPLSPTGKLPLYGLGNFQRGDVVVFRYPGVSSARDDYFIKRVIGLPGDRFRIGDGHVELNGQILAEDYLPLNTRTFVRPMIEQPPVQRPPLELGYLHPDVKHSAVFGVGEAGVVPENTLFVLGDNRELSRDSRSIGFVPMFFVIGRAF